MAFPSDALKATPVLAVEPCTARELLLPSLNTPERYGQCEYMLANSPVMFGFRPNIVGTKWENGNGAGSLSECSGAFYSDANKGGSLIHSSGSGDSPAVISLDASLCSAEYVNEGTLQVKALQILCCIKA